MLNSGTVKITVAAQWFFFYALIILLVPFPLVAGWLVAALIHELGHMFALMIFHIQIHTVNISVFGVQITTEPIETTKEALCALLGPLAGLSTILFAQYLPYVALSGFIQACFNLIPIYPMDGGRILRCLLVPLFSSRVIQVILTCVTITVVVVFILLGVLLSLKYTLGLLPIVFPSAPITFVALKNSLQTRQKNSTIRKEYD